MINVEGNEWIGEVEHQISPARGLTNRFQDQGLLSDSNLNIPPDSHENFLKPVKEISHRLADRVLSGKVSSGKMTGRRSFNLQGV